jgi:hypothetical protein
LVDDDTTQCWLFADVFGRPLQVRLDEDRGSSDGGALLLRSADKRIGVTSALAAAIPEWRMSGKVRHDLGELLGQRVFAIACGYPDANDAARLSEDPVHKLLVGRDPVSGEALASQPTLSRFENALGARTLYRMGSALLDTVIERHRRRLGRRARLITIDLDQTDDPTHGDQQLALFNGHYDSWCYLPLLAFMSFNQERDQYLGAVVLRPGNAPDKLGAMGVLRRLIERLRTAFRRARLRVRLDAGFASPEILDLLDAEGVEYAVGMGKNAVLSRIAEPLMEQARRRTAESGVSEREFGETRYKAGTWPAERRVVIKAEVTRIAGREPKDNPRFVITNLRGTARWVYETFYCHRGDIENRIKELHHGLEIDRTSCSRFLANQCRVLLTAAAYVLMQELRLRAAGTALARAQVWTLREQLLKVGARVSESVRRLVVHLPTSFPFAGPWGVIARRLGASPT